ncbi:hypothetical protein DNTS_027959 [Danionella cerebrum]|uniref:Uncharacterized protein n=1 Tax=Danionella cerebrum TaxID=2873325 RepID=A0A553Q145_9TELE|nr:hypothetical protein DNTS_027959 [Danionella translucida]
MATMVLQAIGLFLALVGWCLESSCLNSSVWKKSSFGDAVITASSHFQGLWLTCASNSLGAIHCQSFKTVLGLPVFGGIMSTGVQLLAFLLCLGGWLLSFMALLNDSWRVSTFSDQLITSVWYYQSLWQSCARGSTGVSNCKVFESMLALAGYIQACRALMIIALVLGLISVILASMGLKCVKLGSSSEETKGKISLTAGILFLFSGLCVLVAVSWYAARVIQEFNDPFYGGTRYELGTGLYLGWAAAALCILGGGTLCTSFKSSSSAYTRGVSYNYSTAQPQKIYRSAPSENSSSKAYV